MIFFSTPTNKMLISRKADTGALLKLAHGVYTDDLVTPLDSQVRDNLIDILEYLEVNGTFAYKSALEYPRDFSGEVILVGDRKRDIDLPGLVVHVFAGSEREKLNHFVEPVRIGTAASNGLSTHGIERAILDSLLSAKPAVKKSDRDLAVRKLDGLLRKGMNEKGEGFKSTLIKRFEHVAALTDTAESLVRVREAIESYALPHSVIHDAGIQYDHDRSVLFDALADKIAMREDKVLPTESYNATEKDRLTFLESYFSNYIEGTMFEIEEAEKIVFDPDHQYTRHDDGHDVLETYRVIRKESDRGRVVQSVDPTDYIRTIKAWHTAMFSHRAHKIIVGSFKEKANKAGNTHFVDPSLVEGTLRLALTMANEVAPGLPRAMFLKACFTEVHPFDDGNGRISRIIMNRELQATTGRRLIVPTVFSEDYVLSIKAFSNGSGAPYIRMMEKLVMLNSSIDWHQPPDRVMAYLYENNAFSDPSDAMWGVKMMSGPDKAEDSNIPLIRL